MGTRIRPLWLLALVLGLVPQLSAAQTVTLGPTTAIAASGPTRDGSMTLVWRMVAEATQYHLRVDDVTGTRVDEYYRADEAGCAARSVCAVTIATAGFMPGSGQWRVQAWSETGEGPWTAPQAFTYAAAVLTRVVTAVPAQTGDRPIAVRADEIRRSRGCEAAIGLYREAVATRPNDGLSHYFLGYCLHVTGDIDAAIEAHARAAGFPAYRAAAMYNLAAAYALAGRPDEAIDALSRSIDLGVRDHDQNGFQIVRDIDFEALKTDPRFLTQIRRLAGDAYELDAVREWEPKVAPQGLAVVMDVIENRHPDAFRYVAPTEFQAHAAAILDRVDRLDVETYALELMRLVARIGDVHSSVWVVSSSDILTNTLPLRLWRFADGLYVRAASPEHADLAGVRITRIGSFDVDAGWDRLVADNPRENDSMATGWLQYLLLLPAFHRLNGWSNETDAATLEIVDRDGVRHSVTLAAPQDLSYGNALESSLGIVDVPETWITARAGMAVTPTWLKDTGSDYRYEKLGEKAAYYLAVNTPRDDPKHPWEEFLAELFAAIANGRASRLIVDLRHNPGGYHYLAQSLAQRIVRSDTLHRPGGVCVLTSRTTQSAGVSFSVALERETYAVFAGEPGAAAPNFFNGPQGFFSPKAIPGAPLTVKYSTSVIQDSDQRDTRRAIAPDMPTPLTFDDFVAGRDPGLEACLQLDDKTAAEFLSDVGGRPLPLYLHWRRPSQAAMFPNGPPGITERGYNQDQALRSPMALDGCFWLTSQRG